MKYQPASLQEILELGNHNSIVRQVLTLFHMADETPGPYLWQQALIHMVKALVEYSDQLAMQNYDFVTKGAKGPQIIINLKDLPEEEKIRILETLGRKGQ
jgi:hypothetical protein